MGFKKSRTLAPRMEKESCAYICSSLSPMDFSTKLIAEDKGSSISTTVVSILLTSKYTYTVERRSLFQPCNQTQIVRLPTNNDLPLPFPVSLSLPSTLPQPTKSLSLASLLSLQSRNRPLSASCTLSLFQVHTAATHSFSVERGYQSLTHSLPVNHNTV